MKSFMLMAYGYYRPHRLLLDSDITVASSPTFHNRTTAYSQDANFDSNMVIILAALLCALVCALGLNSIVRCAIRCTRTYAYEAGGGHSVGPHPVAATSVKKEALLSRIPVVVYRSGLDIPATECPICLGEFVEGEDVRILPGCNHGFHVKCIDKWLVLHSSCPNCRRQLNEHCSTTVNEVRVQIV